MFEEESISKLTALNTFTNHDDFITQVQNYANFYNFQIRKDKVERDKNNNIKKRTILCSRAGVAEQKKEKNHQRDRHSQRCNCPFMIRASFNLQTGLWHILAINLEHNHEMVTFEHKKFLNNERIIPQEIKDRIKIYHQAGCNVSTIKSILKQEYQELEIWIYDDIYNFIYQLDNKLHNRFFEANEFINTLQQFKREINGFEYEIKVDASSNELLQVIWMYPEQKRQYCRFLDVIVFDNTYKVNRFNMPFGIFTGVNNFGQSICFARTLMCQETINSFTWTFESFLKMVNNNPPKVILTDEDKAISQAIQNVFGQNSKHVLCIWHLWKNVIKNLCSILGTNWHNFTKAFYECTKEYEVDNFITKWQQLQIDFPDCKVHLKRMDKVKEKWAPCFNRDTFLADMTSTQHGESMNNLMKNYMNATNSLLDFLKAFESALEQRDIDLQLSKYRQNQFNVILKTMSPFEYQAAEILTSYALKLTQEQLLQASNYSCIELFDLRYLIIVYFYKNY